MTAALLHGAVMSLSLAVLEATGYPFRDFAVESWVLYAGAMASATLLMRIESRVNQTKCKELGRHMEHQTMWNIITARHFPEIRRPGNQC